MFRIAVLFGRLTVLALLLVASGCNQNNNESSISRPTPMTNSRTSINGPVHYVALGDSTGSGVGARNGGYVARLFRKILTHRPESKLTNYCVSGATTFDVLEYQLDRGVSEANFITIGIGINDIGHGFSVEQFSTNYEKILGRLKEKSSAIIIIINIPDISSAPRIPSSLRSQHQQLIIEFNRSLEQIAAKHQVIVFDIFTKTHEQLPLHPEYFSADGFHPSDEGYELWAETMWPAVAKVIGIADQ